MADRADATPAPDPPEIASAVIRAAIEASWTETNRRERMYLDPKLRWRWERLPPQPQLWEEITAALEAAGLRVVAVATIEKLMDDLDAQTAESEALDERLRGVTADRYEQVGWIGPTEQSLDAEEWWFRHEGEAADLLSAEPVYRRVSP